MREADGSQGDIASGFELGGEDDPCAIGSEGGFGGASSVGDQVGDPGEAGTIGMNGEQIGCFVAGCGQCRVHDQLTVRAPPGDPDTFPPVGPDPGSEPAFHLNPRPGSTR